MHAGQISAAPEVLEENASDSILPATSAVKPTQYHSSHPLGVRYSVAIALVQTVLHNSELKSPKSEAIRKLKASFSKHQPRGEQLSVT
jgi:hypothetical protein